jgi:glycosyltransferase involved in cell wall biosynthesis
MTANSALPRVSVVIPTHNPRMDYLVRVIEGLRGQTLPREKWELLVVDNASNVPLKAGAGPRDQETKSLKDEENSGSRDREQESGVSQRADGKRQETPLPSHLRTLPSATPHAVSVRSGGLRLPPSTTHLDLSWHPNARVVSEERVGLTNARLRGFSEATGEVIVLVDDDNVLAPDYLEQVVRIAREYPFLGTWSGALELELEPGSLEPVMQLRHLLCERKPSKDIWSNDRSIFAATPWGAGECIRREVATAYAAKVAKEPRRRQLDLQGEQLVYGGDTDIAYTGLEMGLGMGVFTALHITHLTPKSRCTPEYLLRNYEARAYSEVLHHWVEHGTIPNQRTDLRGRLGVLARRIFGSPLERKMIAARQRGLQRGAVFVTRYS